MSLHPSSGAASTAAGGKGRGKPAAGRPLRSEALQYDPNFLDQSKIGAEYKESASVPGRKVTLKLSPGAASSEGKVVVVSKTRAAPPFATTAKINMQHCP